MIQITEMEKTITENDNNSITEYKFSIGGVPEFIYGRITESLSDKDRPFLWEVSHAWRANPDGHVYFPSSHEFATFDEAHAAMIAYVSGMTPHIQRNENYFHGNTAHHKSEH